MQSYAPLNQTYKKFMFSQLFGLKISPKNFLLYLARLSMQNCCLSVKSADACAILDQWVI